MTALWYTLIALAGIGIWAWWTDREFTKFIAEDDRKEAEFQKRLKQDKKLREEYERRKEEV